MGYIKRFIIIFAFFSHVLSAQHITIVTEHLPPFQIVQKNKEITGLATEIVKESFARANLSYSIAVSDWSIAYKQAAEQKNVCIYSLVRLPFRESLFQWVGQITSASTSFYSLREKNIVLRNFDDALQYRVAVNENYASHHYLLKKGFKKDKTLYVLKNYKALLKMLEVRKDSIDLVLLNDEILINKLDSPSKMKKYRKHSVINDFRFDFFLACSLKTSPVMVEKLSTSLQSMKADNSLKKLTQKWQARLVSGQ
jgi:polar amino acid transport system substrate-binding protein